MYKKNEFLTSKVSIYLREVPMTPTTLTINGETHTVEVSPDMPLLWVLRDIVGLTGTKYSCGQGLCGACTVHADGQAIRSCVSTVSEVASMNITTIEGLSPDGEHPLQKAWVDESVAQCGYCAPGQIMTAAALLEVTPNPTDEDIDVAMSGNLCRCGTYQRIRRAIHSAAGNGGGT
jgi:isoquinoline 1-oxidoreductase alpha subunit